MTETQKRIKAYKKALPFLKERVGVVALLFIMSITMVGSATFAWITLSRAPEINGLATTIASNGNLEIALSDIDGEAPDETKIGDGAGEITAKNLTWGNLINLSHSDYGLSDLTLRPAALNSGNLLTEPLYSVEYTNDGRISETIFDFSYTNYGEKDGAYAFYVRENPEYGVRAISSVTYDSVSGDAAIHSLNTAVKQAYTEADSNFRSLWNNKEYMNSITGLAGVYLQYRIDDTDQDCSSYVAIVYEMLGAYNEALRLTGNTLVASANVHHFVYCNKNNKTYNAFTLDELHDGTIKSTLISEGMTANDTTIKAIDVYIKDHISFNGTAAANYEDGLYSRYYTNVYDPWTKNTSIGWELMRTYINVMADINSATIAGTRADALGASDLVKIAFSSSNVCELQKGLIWNMDWFYGGNISVSGVQAKAMGQTVKIKEVRTSARSKVEDPSNTTYTNYPINAARDVAVAKAAEGGLAATDAVAGDTYGMVVDFWLRTNSPTSLLTLAGDVVTKVMPVLDAEGNQMTDDNGNPMTETVVVGYSGVNRIWEDDDPELPVLGESTSQGSGSCYIFYPETPEDQAQALEMLSAMRVAFVDQNGKLLAQADMDTSMAFEDMGRVLVPLQLRAKSIVTGTDDEGNDIVENAYYITNLVQNEPTRITAIVYMDGSVLDNSSVLSAGSIKGQLNIQFGTSEDLVSVDDSVKSEFYNIILGADKTSFDSFDPENKPKVNLSLSLNGMDATEIKGQFVSYVSATQGANQREFTFTKQSEGGWTAEVTFESAGDFSLRSIRIDGVDYPLDEENIVNVSITGVTINSLTIEGWDGAKSKTLMTADPYYHTTSTLALTTAGSMPKKVQGVFVHDENQNVTLDYTQTNNGWVANAQFTTSGKYTMSYVIVDGAYIPLNTELCKSLDLYLGLRTQVFLGQPMTEKYQADLERIENAEAAEIAAYKEANPNATEETLASAIADIQANYASQKQALYDAAYGKDGLEMSVTSSGYSLTYDGSESLFMDVSCTITDDKGNPMTKLADVALHYGIGSSIVNRLDSNMTWNSASGRYEGEFTLTRPGAYAFQNLEIGKDENKSTIYTATVAPKITAISPVPMEYIGTVHKNTQLNVAELVDINSAYSNPTDNEHNRNMQVALKNAAAATVVFEMYNAENDETVELAGTSVYSDDTDPKNTINYFAPSYTKDGQTGIGLPYDGTWTIKGLKVSGVFYGGTYYDGDTETESATGWLDLGEFLDEDTGILTTKFFTTVKFSANKYPAATYSGGFMEDHKVEDMQIVISDYFGNAIEGLTLDLSYVWNPESRNFATSSDLTSLPNQSFGIASSDGRVFKMENMNFQLEGQYNMTFKITIDGEEYDPTTAFVVENDLAKRGVSVSWTLPTVTIDSIAPTGRQYQTVNSSKNATVSVSSSINGNEANVYSEMKITSGWFGTKKGELVEEASVTLSISNIGNAIQAAMPFTKTSGGTVYLHENTGASNRTNSFLWTPDNLKCLRYVGYNTSDCNSYSPAGTLTSSTVELTYDGVVYTLNGVKTITIRNEYPS